MLCKAEVGLYGMGCNHDEKGYSSQAAVLMGETIKACCRNGDSVPAIVGLQSGPHHITSYCVT